MGPASFITRLKSEIQRVCNVTGGCILPKGKIVDLCFNGNVISKTILDKLYEGSTKETRLERKYALYEELLKYIKPNAKPWTKVDYTSEFKSDLSHGMSTKELSQKHGIKGATISWYKRRNGYIYYIYIRKQRGLITAMYSKWT